MYRLEHLDEVLRSARLSGYLYLRTVIIISVLVYTLLYVLPTVVRSPVSLHRDGQLYLVNQLLSMMILK